MASDGALRVYQASIQPPIGPLTQMQPRTALFVLRPNLPQWLEEADTTITRLRRRTNDDRSYFYDCILKQSLCSTTVITAKAAAKLLATDCCCCFQTAVASLWTYEVTSTEVPIRLLRKLHRRCMPLFTTFWNPDVATPTWCDPSAVQTKFLAGGSCTLWPRHAMCPEMRDTSPSL